MVKPASEVGEVRYAVLDDDDGTPRVHRMQLVSTGLSGKILTWAATDTDRPRAVKRLPKADWGRDPAAAVRDYLGGLVAEMAHVRNAAGLARRIVMAERLLTANDGCLRERRNRMRGG